MSILAVASNVERYQYAHKSDQKHDENAPENVKLVQRAFRLYNPAISDATILTFVDVSKAYGLSDDPDVFRKCVGQICLESNAKQSAISKGNAMGMGQIVPTTAFGILHKLDSVEQAKMRSLGATDIVWAVRGKYAIVEDSTGRKFILPSALREKTKKWLRNERNNIILWAHIMSRKSKKVGFDRALLSYRMGEGAAKNYVGSPVDHPYIKKIYLISNKLQKMEGGAE